MLEIGNIVEIDNGEQYVLLEDVEYQGARFIYALKAINGDDITDESMVFEAVKEDDGEYLAPVEDKVIYEQLIEMFKDKVAEKIDAIKLDEQATE